MNFGGVELSDPVIITFLLLVVAFFYFVLPGLLRTKSTTNYTIPDYSRSNAFHHFGGVGGPGYHNLKLAKNAIITVDGRAEIQLESIPEPFLGLNINPLSPDCDYRIKHTADMVFGNRVDVYWDVDASGKRRQWDNILIQDWGAYTNKLQKSAKSKIMVTQLAEKEFNDEMKGMMNEMSQTDGTLRQ